MFAPIEISGVDVSYIFYQISNIFHWRFPILNDWHFLKIAGYVLRSVVCVSSYLLPKFGGRISTIGEGKA